MNRKNNAVLGGILVILGVLFLFNNMGFISFRIWDIFKLFNKFWPAICLILPGLMFHYGFFRGNHRDPGLLVPGGILTVLGLAFQFNMLFGGWHIMWPIYILSVAVGLFELYLFGNRDRGLLIPVTILGGISAIFFVSFTLPGIFSFNFGRLLIPVILIVLGLAIVFGGRSNRKDF